MDFSSQGSWIPATPAKPIPTKRSLIPTSQAAVPNGLESVGVSAGFRAVSTSWGLENQLRDLGGSEAAAALASASQAPGHNVGPCPPAASDPMERGKQMMPYGNLLAVAGATAASRMTSLVPFMLAQIHGSPAMAAAPNQLLLDGRVLLPKIHSNGNNHHLPQISQCGFPIPILPNLNSLPEKTVSTSMSEAVCSPPTPDKLDKSKRIQDGPPREVIDLVDGNETVGNIQGKEIGMSQPAAEEPAGLCFSKPVMSSQFVCPNQQEGRKNVAMSFEGVSLQQPVLEEHGNVENHGIDLNKTPQPKPRRKKHRPKVIREGKPARTPKPVTPKTVTPKVPRNKESPSGKRKYVRKKKVLHSSDAFSYPLGEIVNPECVSGTKSIKRCLNFDSEEPQARDGPPGSWLMFAWNTEAQAQDACVSDTIAKSAGPYAQGWEVLVENSQAGITFDLNSSANEMSNENIRIPQTPTPPSQPSRREPTRINHKPSGYIRVVKTPPPPSQHSRREIIKENLKEFAWKNEHLNIAGNSDRSLEYGQKSQLHSNTNSNVLLRGTKRGHILVDEDHISRHINLMHAYNEIDRIRESRDTSSHGPYFPEIHKKKRTERRQNELASNTSSSVTCTPSSWKRSLVVPNNYEVFTFADAQRLMVLEKQQSSEHMLSFDQRETKTKKRSKVLAQADNSTSTSVTENCNNLSTPLKPSGFSNTDCTQLSSPEKVLRCIDSQESEICEPQNNNVKMKPKKRTKKEQIHLVKPVSSNTNQRCLQEHGAASCNYGSSHGQNSIQITASTSVNFDHKNSHLRVSSLQDCQSSSNFKESLHGISPPGTIVLYGDPVDDIIWKLNCLNINRDHEIATAEAQNALVPYGGGGSTVVPYEGPFDITKKRRPRPKVDLDPESNRVWKVLMGKESSDEGADMDKEKWWEEERRIFRGRVDSFIARMHLVQGDRRFSQWKGSVVDSVVGVFLTQNVSDHLSSSAFMSLAARFPLRPKGNNSKLNAEKMSRSTQLPDGSQIAFDDSIKWQGPMLGQELCYRGSLVIPEAEHMAEKEMVNSSVLLGSNTGDSVVDYSEGKGLDVHERELEIGHESPDSTTNTLVTVTGSASAAETEDRSIEVVSSQNSVVSSQNSSESLVQTVDQIQLSPLSNVDAEDFIYGSMSNVLDSSTSFMELLQMAESTRFQELYGHGNGNISSTEYCSMIDQLTCLEVNKRTPVFDQLDNFKGECSSMYISNSHPHDTPHDFTGVSCDPSPSYHLDSSSNSRLTAMGNVNAVREESSLHLPSTTLGMSTTNNNIIGRRCGPSAGSSTEAVRQQMLLFTSRTAPELGTYASLRKNSVQSLTSSGTEGCMDKHSCYYSGLPKERNEASSGKNTPHKCSHLQNEKTDKFQQKERVVEFQVESTEHADRAQAQMQNCRVHQTCLTSHNNLRETLEIAEALESNLKDEAYSSQKVSAATENSASKAKKVKAETEKKKIYDWDNLRKQACRNGAKKERSRDTMDSLDWEAVRCADVSEISQTIRERGMNNMLAERIKEFLNRLVKDHGSIDLEWLRDVPPDSTKDYLLSIRGLGLKSVECVRLLTLRHLAFPVDTNVGRICVRLGWVPLQPLPESLQLHLLEMYPVLETIQKYIWPRLCKLDQRTLYELHYQMITFGKVFCTKSKPNCNACPMRGECKHFASAFASARLALPGQEEKGLVSSTIPIVFEAGHTPLCSTMPLPQLEGSTFSREVTVLNNCEPIIEEPATPEPEFIEISESAIEEDFFEDPDEIPHIKLNLEAFTQNVQDYAQANNMELQDGDLSKALVALTREAASIPMPKLKNVSRLRTEHQVYELPDSHPLLEGFDHRETDDPCSYLLAIWSPGETAQSTEPPKICCNSQDMGKLCDKKTCFACNCIREEQAQTVRGTLLIPCRTAMKGSFPLNGTYFQVNEVFADHDSSCNPIDVPRQWIWNLPRRTVYFGTSIPTIFKGLTTEGIQQCFWKGFVCVRGFDRTTRAPKPLYARLHFPASKAPRNKKAAAEAAAAAAARKEE